MNSLQVRIQAAWDELPKKQRLKLIEKVAYDSMSNFIAHSCGTPSLCRRILPPVADKETSE